MRIIGPNSQGLANFGTGAVASFSTMFIEVEPADGPVGIISQSGMMSVVPYGLLRQRGIGVRHAHATGNDADVTLSELALAVVEDPAVRLLLLYIESIKDAAMLARVAAVARERDVPIVAVKTGRTVRGQAAARSHTGALANEDRVVDAFFREHGIWRVGDVHELVSAAEAVSEGLASVRPPAGRRQQLGCGCVMAADAAPGLGLELEPLAATDDGGAGGATAELRDGDQSGRRHRRAPDQQQPARGHPVGPGRHRRRRSAAARAAGRRRRLRRRRPSRPRPPTTPR